MEAESRHNKKTNKQACDGSSNKIDPYLGGALAVVESVSNVACVGAQPLAITDCLNFGNPEDPYVMNDFIEAVRGIGDAARALKAQGCDEALPVVSGNVSFYNESASGKAIPPSPVVACYGVIDDYSVAQSLTFKEPGSEILLLGRGQGGLGGSAFLAWLGKPNSGELPVLDLEGRRRAINTVIQIVRLGHALACHDVSDGGLFISLAEMAIGAWGYGNLGVSVKLDGEAGESILNLLFAENGGFLIECRSKSLPEIERICRSTGTTSLWIGKTIPDSVLEVSWHGGNLVLDLTDVRAAWQGALQEAIK